jgi:nucleoside-diphosphate-sugar epimerase
LLITGADGFTGRHLVASARARGYDIVALQANLTDKEAVQREVAAVAADWVVHLAAISFVGHADSSAFYHVNVIGTLNLLSALASLAQPPQSILLASSANVYGNCVRSPIPEEQPPAPVNHYATSKLAMEHMARTYLPQLPLFFVRPFNYTGPGQDTSFLIPKLVTHFAQRAPTLELGNLEVEREFNDVRFVCDAYFRLLEKATPGDVYNVCSGQPVTLKGVLSLLGQLTAHHPDIRVNPAFVRANEIHRLCGNPAKLMATIGIGEQVPLQETLRWMLESA